MLWRKGLAGKISVTAVPPKIILLRRIPRSLARLAQRWPKRAAERMAVFRILSAIKNMNKFLKSKSITLVELTVVISIMIVIYGTALLGRDFVFSRSLQADARLIVNDLTWARSLALANHTNHCVRFFNAAMSASSDGYTIYRGTCGTGAVLKNYTFMSQITFPTTMPDVIFFAPSATALGGSADVTQGVSGGTGTLNVTLGSSTKTIRIVEGTGYVRLTN